MGYPINLVLKQNNSAIIVSNVPICSIALDSVFLQNLKLLDIFCYEINYIYHQTLQGIFLLSLSMFTSHKMGFGGSLAYRYNNEILVWYRLGALCLLTNAYDTFADRRLYSHGTFLT